MQKTKNYLNEWKCSFLGLPSLELKSTFKIRGVHKKHLGPRIEYAAFDLIVNPSEKLIIEISNEISRFDEYSQKLLDSAIFGIFDIILTTESIPLTKIKIKIMGIDVHPVDSNLASFRKAGRNAGTQIMESIAKA